jgi:dihydroneopterin aldolase
VIPLSLFTHHTTKYAQFMKRIMTLMECKKYNLVSLTTKDLKEWSTALEAFSEITLDMIKNQIVV